MSVDHPANKEREFFCEFCGDSLGFAKHMDRMDRCCGKVECARGFREMEAESREEAHRDLDDRMGWS